MKEAPPLMGGAFLLFTCNASRQWSSASITVVVCIGIGGTTLQANLVPQNPRLEHLAHNVS